MIFKKKTFKKTHSKNHLSNNLYIISHFHTYIIIFKIVPKNKSFREIIINLFLKKLIDKHIF